MSKGFLVLAQNSDSVDYIQQAYALALSIRWSQKTVTNISLATDDVVPEEYQSAFDKIISIPFGSSDNVSLYRAENRWKLYYASPYDETIVLDTDMLVLEDLDSWWKYCENYDIRYCNRIQNYKLETVQDKLHRKTFLANKLSCPYAALHYFKKSNSAYEFYKVLEFVCNNWEWCWDKFAPDEYQKWLSMDLAVAVAIEITGAYDIVDVNNPMQFVHMKPHLQGWKTLSSVWQDFVLTNFTNALTVSNIKQQKLFHYIENDFLSENILLRLKELARG